MPAIRLSSIFPALALLLAGCALPMLPQKPVTDGQALTARPQPSQTRTADGAIYQDGMRGLFDDRRAHDVGDTLLIQIAENNQASKKAATDTSRKADASFGVPTLIGLPGKSFLNAGLSANSGNTFAGAGDSSITNSFTGTVACTVTEALSNGNLRVGCDKQVQINQGTEIIRLTGVINPCFISPANTVESYQVADARIEYVGRGAVDETQTMGWLQRFFLSVLPF